MKVAGAGRAAPGRPARARALRRHRRRRAVRDRPDHAGPRHPGQRQRRRRVARPSTRCARSARGCTSATPPTQLGDADTVVVSTAVREDNPEYVEARRPRAPGAAALGRAGRGDGRPPGGRGGRDPRQDHDHRAADRRPAGGRRGPDVRHRRRPRRDRRSTRRRAPATCSSPRPTRATAPSSSTAPYAAIVTNVEADHLDHWGTEEAYAAAFDEFAATVDPDGFLVCCVDDAGAAALAERQRAAGRRVVTVSTRPGVADVGPEALAGVSLWSPGDHYLADALLALAAGRDARASPTPTCVARHRVVHRHPAPDGAQGRGRRRPRLRQLRPPPDRDRRRPRGRARAGGRGRGWSSRSSRTWSRAPARFGAAMGEALGAADEVVVLRRLPGPRGPRPRGDRRAGRGRRTPASRAGRLRARPRRRRRPRWSPAPAPATWCSPSAPAASPRSARRCSRCSRAPVRSLRRGRPTAPTAASRSTRPPGAAAAVRAPAVAAPLAGLALPARDRAGARARGRRDLGGVVLVLAGGRDRSTSAAPRPSRPPTSGRARASTSASRWSGSTSPRPSAGSASLAVVRSVEVTRQWPNGILVSLEERVADRRRRDRRPAARHGRRRRGLPRLQEGAARPPARRDLDRHHVGGARGGRQGDLGAAPGPHPPRRPRPGRRPSTRSRWCSRTAARWSGGARTSPTPRPRCSTTLLATVQAQVYDVSVPSKPTTC